MNKTEYIITRRGTGIVTKSGYDDSHNLFVDDHLLGCDFHQLVEDAAASIDNNTAVAVTITLSVESLGKSYEHYKRTVRSVDIDADPEVI